MNELGDSLPDSDKENANSSMITRRAYFSGPLPPPQILQAYNDIEPGLADRIVRMAENQSAHRQSMEKEVIGASIWSEKAGIWFGGLLTIFALVIGAWLLLNDKDLAGWTTLLSILGFQGINFLFSRNQGKQSQNDRDNKDEATQERLF